MKKIAARHVPNQNGSGTVVISLGGSLIFPKEGIDAHFLKQFRSLILRYVRKGWRFVIITGGGTIARQYQDALRHAGVVSSVEHDWIAIRVTRVNAHLLRIVFGNFARDAIMTKPTEIGVASFADKKIILAGGEKPGQTTDHVAVQCALRLHARLVVNLSNVDYIYDRDPKKKGAKPLRHVSWKEFQKLFPNIHTPGAHIPFDPRARRLAERANLTVAFLGKNLSNLDAFFRDKKFRGTVVSAG